jgi:hypothetical protein
MCVIKRRKDKKLSLKYRQWIHTHQKQSLIVLLLCHVKKCDDKHVVITRTVVVEQTGTQESLPTQSDDADCLGCKVVATGTLLGASSYVAYYTFKNRSKYTGRYKVAFYGQNLSLLTCKYCILICMLIAQRVCILYILAGTS